MAPTEQGKAEKGFSLESAKGGVRHGRDDSKCLTRVLSRKGWSCSLGEEGSLPSS